MVSLALMEPVLSPPHDSLAVEFIRILPSLIIGILTGLPGLIMAIRANRTAVKAARKQISFALEDAVISGAISAPSDSALRTRSTPEVS